MNRGRCRSVVETEVSEWRGGVAHPHRADCDGGAGGVTEMSRAPYTGHHASQNEYCLTARGAAHSALRQAAQSWREPRPTPGRQANGSYQ